MPLLIPLTVVSAMIALLLWNLRKPAEYWESVARHHFSEADEAGRKIVTSRRATECRIDELKAGFRL